MQPTVYTTKDAVIVLYGFVYDTEVLHPSVWAGAMGGGTLDNCNRGGNSLDNHRGHLDSFEDQGMAEWVGNADAGAGTAQLILAHVLRATRDGGRLSEVVADIQVRLSLPALVVSNSF